MTQDSIVAATALLGLALILATSIHALARLRIARLTALQTLIAQGTAPEAALDLIDPGRDTRLLRRGLLLLALAIAWSATTAMIGGKAWIAGIAPALLGLACLVLHVAERRRR
jgi:hypothetical protein